MKLKLSLLSKLPKVINTIVVFTVIFSFSAFIFSPTVRALSLEEELQQVQKELEQIRQNKASLESDINNEKGLQSEYDVKISNLKNSIDLLDNKIAEKKLVIKELELEIDILTKKLKTTKKDISSAEGEILGLEDETNDRLIDLYLTQKTSSEIDLLVSPDGQSDIIKINLYQNSIQDDTNNLVGNLKGKRESLQQRKEELEEDRIVVQRDEVQLEEELVALQKDEAELATQRSAYFSLKQNSIAKVESNSNEISDLTAEQKELDARYSAIIAQILSRGELTDGVPVNKGTFLGYEGWTGYTRPSNPTAAHLHFGVLVDGVPQNPCNYLPSNAYSPNNYLNASCSGNGSLALPMSPKGYYHQTFSSGSHNAIDISTRVSGGSGVISAAHKGFVYFGYSYYCPGGQCNGSAIYAKVCEVNGCSSGLSTIYWHLKCTGEPSSSSRSCK